VPDTSSLPDLAGGATPAVQSGDYPLDAAAAEGLETDGPGTDRLPEVAWVLLWLIGLVVIVTTPRWAAISFYLIWISFALLYGLRVWPLRPALRLVAVVTASTAAAGFFNVVRDIEPVATLSKVPLMTAMFCTIVWQAHRRLAADSARSAVSAQNERLLAAQRRFLMDASHQLKTPITIALGHAELLARELASLDGKRDIQVVVGELNRLKSLSERLLLIAASENPDFLLPLPLPLPLFAMELLQRWRPAAQRHWRIGQLDEAVVAADSDRLALALDALLENAVQHTGEDDVIRVSVLRDDHARFACVVIEDSGDGIPRAELTHIFDRFRTGPASTGWQTAGRRGTGLGLPLAQAIAGGHGGQLRVRSELGQGSRFEFLLPILPATSAAAARPAAAAEPAADCAASPGSVVRPASAVHPRTVR
jgi:signal transduction histidine kinase